ncbi:MAG: signal peptide peptidase SppA [Thalassotalea sp.]
MIGRLFSKLWRILNLTRIIILNLIFFILLAVFIAALSSDKGEINIPQGAALVLNLKGQLVEQKQQINPMDAFVAEAMEQPEDNPEVLISDVLFAIKAAKSDDRISLLVLKLGMLQNSGLSKLQDVAHAIEDFKTSGKQVIATGDQYSQAQYYLASYANEIWLNPKGWLLFEGFNSYQVYFKSALEKLSINQHIFRVGTYKSAVEPFIRDDMSPAAKEANLLWLSDLWGQYKSDVAAQRGIDVSNFDEKAETLITKLAAANGNMAEYAKFNNWVDALKTRQEMTTALIELVGESNKDAYNQIRFKDYLKVQKPAIAFENPSTDKVAVIIAKGNILNGTQKPGTIGGTSTAKLLKQARLDDSVKAVVLRVDSPGGSAFASEIIRQEVVQLKAAGKPVVASMGTYAASGGYWISASADKIIASPSTITGSIGIFGLMMTFEESLAKLGVYTDGVGTTDIGSFGVTRPLDDNIGKLIQLNIERGYQDFIALVAESRNMTLAQVDAVAQGRVWSGVKAKELGLVDELGNLDDAINAAATIAGLDNFESKLIEKKPSSMDKFLRDMLGQSAKLLLSPTLEVDTLTSSGPVDLLMKRLNTEVKQFNQFNDPNGAYSFCLQCDVN